MRLRVLALGRKMPAWVEAGWKDYAKRLRKPFKPELIELTPGARQQLTVAQCIEQESEQLLARIGADERVVALDERGKSWRTRDLAGHLDDWSHDGRDLCFIIGGPDGLGEAVKQRADVLWSLSALTLPHAMVRVVLIEQLYRAHAILQGHPYHRD